MSTEALKPLKGIFCLVPTVFDKNGDLDIEGFKENIKYLETTGMHGIVTMASIGQYFLLNDEEFKKLADAARETCKKMLCIIGCHTQNTAVTVARSQYVESIGADASYFITPYYSNWTDPESCFAHLKAIHDATSTIRLMAYNYDAAGFTIDISLWERLLNAFPRLAVVKECTPMIEAAELMRRYADRISIISGCETNLYPFMLFGGAGSVAVWATGYAKFMVKFYEACEEKRWDKALEYHQLLNLYKQEWHSGPYVRDNKCTAMAVGLHGGYQKPPWKTATEKDIEYHKKWIAKLNKAVEKIEAK